ncbi:DUF2474 domain-containing protein [Pseudoxanthomonas sp.]|nr:DUF2474 domain-containing protein [Pseudoxanthomonas sp.]WDS34845.1 MAG: DUF2474 domain-containing protein [Pseudoxanthomonas sp.]
MTAPKSWLRRIGWLVLIWACSVGALLLVSMLIRAAMGAVGFRIS